MRLTGDTHTDLDRAFRRGLIIGFSGGIVGSVIGQVIVGVVQT